MSVWAAGSPTGLGPVERRRPVERRDAFLAVSQSRVVHGQQQRHTTRTSLVNDNHNNSNNREEGQQGSLKTVLNRRLGLARLGSAWLGSACLLGWNDAHLD